MVNELSRLTGTGPAGSIELVRAGIEAAQQLGQLVDTALASWEEQFEVVRPSGRIGPAAVPGRPGLLRGLLRRSQAQVPLPRTGDGIAARRTGLVTGLRPAPPAVRLPPVGWAHGPADPVSIPESGRVQFDLSPVPPGGHEIRVLAWATDPVANLAAVSLPRLTFRPDPESAGPGGAAGLVAIRGPAWPRPGVPGPGRAGR